MAVGTIVGAAVGSFVGGAQWTLASVVLQFFATHRGQSLATEPSLLIDRQWHAAVGALVGMAVGTIVGAAVGSFVGGAQWTLASVVLQFLATHRGQSLATDPSLLIARQWHLDLTGFFFFVFLLFLAFLN